MKNNCLNYQAIYADLIAFKKDEKLKVEDTILNTFKFNSSLDVLEFNSLLFPNENVDTAIANQKLKSYTLEDISRILTCKKAQNLSLKEVSYKFKISKGTLLRWIKLFGSKEIC
jgi:response regulator of citrate/malate metabolism